MSNPNQVPRIGGSSGARPIDYKLFHSEHLKNELSRDLPETAARHTLSYLKFSYQVKNLNTDESLPDKILPKSLNSVVARAPDRLYGDLAHRQS